MRLTDLEEPSFVSPKHQGKQTMKRRKLVLSFAGAGVACLGITAHALHTLHTIEYAMHFDSTVFTRTVATAVATRTGAALITLVLAALALTCITLWRRGKRKGEPAMSQPSLGGQTLEEDEEIRETSTNKLLGTRRVRIVKRRRKVV